MILKNKLENMKDLVFLKLIYRELFSFMRIGKILQHTRHLYGLKIGIQDKHQIVM